MDVFLKNRIHQSNREKVIICLHGITGSSDDRYIQEVRAHGNDRGYNLVVLNHYAPPGEQGLRLMDMTKNQYINEVIEYTKKRFDQEGKECDLYLIGFSLGGNHVLRYVGESSKKKIRPDEEELIISQDDLSVLD